MAAPQKKVLKPTGLIADPLVLSASGKPASSAKQELQKSLELSRSNSGYHCYDQAKTKWMARCASCQLRITREQALKKNVIFTLDRFWHKDHFTCFKCNAAIGTDGIGFRKSASNPNKPICVDCHMDDTHPPCAGCGKPLKETALVAMDKKWHKCCFVCFRCRCPMPDNEYYAFMGQAFDMDCYFYRKYENQLGTATSPMGHAFMSDPSPTNSTVSSVVSSKGIPSNVIPEKPKEMKIIPPTARDIKPKGAAVHKSSTSSSPKPTAVQKAATPANFFMRK